MLWRIKSYLNYFLRRFAQVLQILKCPKSICIRINKLHHCIVLKELHNVFIKSYSHYLNSKSSEGHDSGIIWTFWWQGYKSMPPLVKECLKSLREKSNGHKVILITKDNIKKYSSMPSYIYLKVKRGQISLTHLSDVLRFSLLDQYGGLWLDSTIFCANNLTSKYFNKLYTSNVGGDKFHFSISLGKWTSFIIGGLKNESLFEFMTIFFNIYWKKYNHVIDYFMMDYALYYAYCHNIGDFHEYVNKDMDQPSIFKLVGLMSKNYNEEEYKELKQNTSVFKLTYKKNFKYQKGTYYYKFLNDEL